MTIPRNWTEHCALNGQKHDTVPGVKSSLIAHRPQWHKQSRRCRCLALATSETRSSWSSMVYEEASVVGMLVGIV